jgi:hypothetical protein
MGGKLDILHDNVMGLDLEPFSLISSAKRTFVVRTADRYLQQDTVGLAGRSNHISFVMHQKLLQVQVPLDFVNRILSLWWQFGNQAASFYCKEKVGGRIQNYWAY